MAVLRFTNKGGDYGHGDGLIEAHLDKSTHDKYTHLNRLTAIQDVGGHNCSVLGEGVW